MRRSKLTDAEKKAALESYVSVWNSTHSKEDQIVLDIPLSTTLLSNKRPTRFPKQCFICGGAMRGSYDEWAKCHKCVKPKKKA